MPNEAFGEGSVDDRLATRHGVVKGIRHLLLTDERLTEEDGLTERELGKRLNISRIPVREALAVLRTLGVVTVPEGTKRYQATLLVNPNGTPDEAKSELWRNVRCELLGNGRSALTRFVETNGSLEERNERLAPVRDRLEDVACRANANTIEERGRTVLVVNDAVAELAVAGGLRWAGDVIRSGLDIIEISTRCAQQGREGPAADPFPANEICARIDGCLAICESLRTVADEEQAIEEAQEAFLAYVDDRLGHLEHLAAFAVPAAAPLSASAALAA